MVKHNYYGFDIDKVNQVLKADLVYCNDATVNNEYNPVSIFYTANPDVSKGHKNYVLIQQTENGGLIRGMTPDEIAPFRRVDAVHCTACNDVVYSPNRHSMIACSCDNVFIDGGRDYTRLGAKDFSKLCKVVLDILTNEIIDLN